MKRMAVVTVLLSMLISLASSQERPASRRTDRRAIAATDASDDEVLFTPHEMEIGRGWRLAASGRLDSQNKQELAYYDIFRVSKFATTYRAWLKYVSKDNGQVASHMLALEDHDCKRQQTRLVEAIS